MAGLKTYVPFYHANAVEQVSLLVKNDNRLVHAVAVDLVFIFDQTVQANLENIDAQTWFNEKPGYRASYGGKIKLLSWELVRGYSASTQTLPDDHEDALSVVVFARYPNNPNTKAIVSELAHPWILLDASQMLVSETQPSATITVGSAQ